MAREWHTVPATEPTYSRARAGPGDHEAASGYEGRVLQIDWTRDGLNPDEELREFRLDELVAAPAAHLSRGVRRP